MSAGPAPRPPEAHHCPITMLAPGWRASHLQVVVTQAFFEYIKRRYLPYVSKEGTLIEIGVKPMENGKKRKLLEFKEAIDLGKNVLEITDSPSLFGTFLQYRSGLMAYSEYKRFKQLRTNREAPEVYIRIGPPGTGKTRWLDEHYGLDKWIEALDNTGKWFDGCDLADILVFNDVQLGAVPPLDIFKKITESVQKGSMAA